MLAHFPPPVHGMAVAVEAVRRMLEEERRVVCWSIAPHATDRSLSHHARRAARLVVAIVLLVLQRPRARSLYVSVDGERGQVYTLLIAVAARLLRYDVFLHHHSFAYVDRRSRLTAAMIRAAGRRAVHVVHCSRMARGLREHYPGIASTREVPVSFALDAPSLGFVALPAEDEALRLGHFANLTVEKGLGRCFDTLDALRAAGVEARLVLGGRIVGEDDRRLLTAALARAEGAAEYLGACHRDDVLRRSDVFLFPTRYVNESWGLVAWEAMLHGVPVIAHEAGCLTDEILGRGGAAYPARAEFAPAALPLLSAWARDTARREEAGRAARVVAEEWRLTGRRALRQLICEM